MSAPAIYAPVSVAIFQNRDFKESARVVTAAALATNTRTGNVLTASGNASLNTAGIDGVTTLAVADRVLVKNEVTGANNGLYVITSLGSAGTPWVLTRATDADTSAKVTSGLVIYSAEGTANGGKLWALTTADPITLNTTALTFAVAGGAVTSLTGTANEISVSASTGAVIISLPSALTFTGKTITGGTYASPILSAANANGVIYANASGVLTSTTVGTAGHVLTSNGTGVAPTFQAAGGVTSITGTSGQVTASASTGAVTLSLPSALTGINSITSAAGQAVVIATGTSGTAISIASATNIVTFSAGIVGTAGTFSGALIATSLTAPTNTTLTLATLDNNKDVIFSPHGTGNVLTAKTFYVTNVAVIDTATNALRAWGDGSGQTLGTSDHRWARLFVGSTGIIIGNGTNGITFTTVGTSPNESLVITAGGSTALTITSVLAATFGSSITTAAPSGGTAGAWKFGIRVAATVALDVTQYIQLDIGGTLYKLGLVS